MSAPSSLNEQWHPTPARLIRAVLEAPTPKRRQWARQYREMWEIVFHKAARGESVPLRELMAWADCPNKDRARAARTDALESFQQWESSRPKLAQASPKPRPEVSAFTASSQAPLAQASPKSRPLARALPSTSTNYSFTGGGDRSASTPTPEAPPTPTSPPKKIQASSEEEVEGPAPQLVVSPQSKDWTSPDAFWSVWSKAWADADWGTAPRRGANHIPDILNAWRAEKVTATEATALVVLWLKDDSRWPSDSIPQLYNLPQVYRKYLTQVRKAADPKRKRLTRAERRKLFEFKPGPTTRLARRVS